MRLALFVLALAALWPRPAEALLCHALLGCSCDVGVTDVDFGAFSPFDGAQEAEGEISVDCTGIIETAPTIAVRLNQGQWGSVSARKMHASGNHLLDYGLYTSDQHTTVWGDGTSGSTALVLSGGLLGLGHWRVSRTVFGLTTPTVTTRPGDYSDTVIVRIDW